MNHTIETDYGTMFSSKGILEALDRAGVFSAYAMNGKFVVQEQHDCCNSVRLTSEQLRLLGEELIALSKSPA